MITSTPGDVASEHPAQALEHILRDDAGDTCDPTLESAASPVNALSNFANHERRSHLCQGVKPGARSLQSLQRC